MRRLRGVLLPALAGILAPAAASAQLPPPVQRAADATVLIEATWEIRGRFQGAAAREFVDSNGSGFLIGPRGIILTNSHVVDPVHVEDAVKRELAELARWIDFSVRRRSLSVRAFSGRDDEIKRPGNVVRTDRKHDLAIMSVNFGRDLPYLRLQSAESLGVGQRIIVCGFPANSVMRTLVKDRGTRGTEVSVSQGRITALRRDRNQKTRLLQMDAAVVGGNSGGPVIDATGRVVGVLSSTVGSGVNFAIAAPTVVDFARKYVPEADRPARPDDADAASPAPPVPPAGGQEVIVHLKNGMQERGILKRQSASGVTLKLPGLGTITYRAQEITRIEPVAE